MSTIGNVSSVYVKNSKHHGRGLFVSEAIAAGTSVFELERPMIAVLDSPRLFDTCANCFQGTVQPIQSIVQNDEVNPSCVKACSGCSMIRYCSKKCQIESWRRSHKSECKLFKTISSRGSLPHAARAVLQMISLHESESSLAFDGLYSHLDDIESVGGEKFDSLLVLSTGIQKYSQTKLSIEIVRQFFAIVFTNSLSLDNATYDPLGISLDPFVAMTNHSCDPNAIVVYNGPRLSIRTLKNITKNEEIFISYVDCTNPFYRRQRELHERFYFTCQCTKCQKGPTLILEDTFHKSLEEIKVILDGRADEITKFNFVNPPTEYSADYVGPDAVSQKLGSIQRFGFERVDKSRLINNNQHESNSTQQILGFMIESSIWPLTRQPLPSLMQQVFVSFLIPPEPSWMRAFRLGVKVVCMVDPLIYPQTFHPIRVVHQWTLAKLILFIGEQEEDEKLLLEARKFARDMDLDFSILYMTLILDIGDRVAQSHGIESDFAMIVKKAVDMVKYRINVLPGHLHSRFEQQKAAMKAIAEMSDT